MLNGIISIILTVTEQNFSPMLIKCGKNKRR